MNVYGACSNAWGSYINGSLRSLITTGKGQPNEKEEGDRRPPQSKRLTHDRPPPHSPMRKQARVYRGELSEGQGRLPHRGTLPEAGLCPSGGRATMVRLYGRPSFGGPAGGTVYKLNKDGTGRTSSSH